MRSRRFRGLTLVVSRGGIEAPTHGFSGLQDGRRRSLVSRIRVVGTRYSRSAAAVGTGKGPQKAGNGCVEQNNGPAARSRKQHQAHNRQDDQSR